MTNSMNRRERRADQRWVEGRIRRQQVYPCVDPYLVASDIEQHLAGSRAYRPRKSESPRRQDRLLVRNVGGSVSGQLPYDEVLDRECGLVGDQPPDAALLAARGNLHVLDRGTTAVRPSDGFRVIGQHGRTIPHGSKPAHHQEVVRCRADDWACRPLYTRRRGRPSVTRAFESSVDLLALHAVRLKGMADDGEVAARFGLDLAVATECLLDFQAFGWITRVEFASTAGWTLTEPGRAKNERQLAAELASTGSTPSVRKSYEEFLLHNGRLLRASTDWQLRPSDVDALAINDHTDKAWDQRVLNTLSALTEELRSLCLALGGRLSRFRGYDARFSAALQRVETGDLSWVNRPKVDSCHTVWMELHEDLVATLGIRRGAEPG